MTIAERLNFSKHSGAVLEEDAYVDASKLISSKSRLPRDMLLVSVLVLASLGSFGLGVLAGQEGGGGEPDERLWIEKLDRPALPGAAGLAAGTTSLGVSIGDSGPAPTAPASGGEIVASKSGTKYYLPWCGTAKRIKEENKVWFASKAEAEAAGYEPAKNCKGL